MYVYGQIAENMEYSSANLRPRLAGNTSSDSMRYSANSFQTYAKALSGAAGVISAAIQLVNVAGSSTLVPLVGGFISLGPLVAALAPIVAIIPIVTLPVVIWRRRVNRSNAIVSLIETIRAEIRKLREGLDDLEDGITRSLENLRMMSFNRDKRNVIAPD